jgi:hypothetical protein
MIKKAICLVFILVSPFSVCRPCLGGDSDELQKKDWANGGYFKLGVVNGRQILVDPHGDPFYSIGMVYAYDPERGPLAGKLSAEKVIEELASMKRHGFNTLNLYGERFLDEILSWCDKNKMAVYFRTNYTPDLKDFPKKLSEFPDFMDPVFRRNSQRYYDKFLNAIKKYHSVLAVDMDQRWLFDLDYGGGKRYGTPKLGPAGVRRLPAWLRKKYNGDIDILNGLWRKKYREFEDVLQDGQIVANGAVQDLKRHPWRVDIVEYTQWTINDFLREQTAYMRSIDPNHLITYTTDWPEIIPFPISTKENSGIDFISPVHYNALQDFHRDWISNGELIYQTKWHNDLSHLPVYISETGFRTSPLEQNPPNMTYAMAEKGNEYHQAQMYLEQTTLMDVYPWFLGWAWFKWYDKYSEGDFGYLRDDGSLKPVSRLGQYLNNKIAVNMKAEKRPQVWIYYPDYALASPYPSFDQCRSLVMILEHEFLAEHEKMINEALKFVITPDKSVAGTELLNKLTNAFDEKWLPFAFTSTIPEDDKPVILAGRALEQLSLADRKALAGKRTITFGRVGISDERYNDTEHWYAEIVGIKPQDYAKEIIHIELNRLFNNDGISWNGNKKDGDFDGLGNTFSAEKLPSGNEIFSADEGIGFIFPDKEDGASNNIKCSGQIVDVKEDNYNEIFFLVAAHGGDACGEVVLNYSDGSNQARHLGPTVSDWRYKPSFAKIAAQSYLNSKTHDANQNAYISQISAPCSVEKRLASIQLPANGNIHVFAISLIKGGVVDNAQVTVTSKKGNKQAGLTSWMLSLKRKKQASYKILATFKNGSPAIVQSKDGQHTSFLYDPFTSQGSDNDISLDASGGSQILKEALF